jgi:HSP20 family protein
MNNLTRFHPFRDLVRTDPLRDVEEFFRDMRMFPTMRGMDVEPRIRMDISETEQAYTIKADIPGVKKEDIKVAVDGNTVSISAEIKRESTEDSNSKQLGSERYYGQQYRSVSLAQEVDDSQAKATYQDGVLELTLPKKPNTGGKQLTIH